jgi:putative acetyltransferase
MENAEYNLRLGGASDFDALYEIYMDKQVNLFLSFEIMAKEKFKPLFLEILQSGSLYVYTDDKHIVATCIVKRLKRRAAHVASLGTLATHPAFQGKGIGTQFMNALIAKLKIEGIRRIDLCAEADNPKAIGFYQKLGFELEGILKQYFRREGESQFIDEHLMAMILE